MQELQEAERLAGEFLEEATQAVVGDWGPEAVTTARPRPRGPPPPLAAAPPLPLAPLLRAPLDLRCRSSGVEEAQASVHLPPLPRPATRRIRWSRVQEAAAGRRSRPRLQEAATGRRSRLRLEGQRAAAPLSPSTAQMEALDGDLDDNGEGAVDRAGGRRTLQSTANAPRRGAGLQAEAETVWDPQRLGRERPRFPENAVPWGGHHKMQQVLRLLLEC
jgi:hypothetical protein